jgi:NitT/TauT family transport system ATP-binding protein
MEITLVARRQYRTTVKRNIMIQISNISVKYSRLGREVIALDGLTASINPNELCCVIGPSGCGKSTLLHVLAGFVKPTGGQVTSDGEFIERPGIDRGVVFQRFSLFPWETVRGNIQFGLVRKNMHADEISKVVEVYLHQIELADFADSYPHELSIGMQQRVAIARAFANNPKILLMDEPFGSLDNQTATRMREWLLRIWGKESKTIVFVTHDIDEAIMLADRIIVLSSRPGTVIREIVVDISRPRGLDAFSLPRYIEIRKELITTILGTKTKGQEAHGA